MAAKGALKSSVCDKVHLSKSEIYALIKANMKNKWAEGLAKYQHSQYINHNGISFKTAADLLHLETGGQGCDAIKP